MLDEFDLLEPKQQRAVVELLNQPTIRDAAKAAGVAESTLHRWLKAPDFAGAYRAARRDALEQATATLQRIASKAAATLERVMDDPKASNPSKIAAARTALDFAYKANDLAEIAALLDEIKEHDERERDYAT
jgi:DNA-binding MurR/RpiR family transcriptional regulator